MQGGMVRTAHAVRIIARGIVVICAHDGPERIWASDLSIFLLLSIVIRAYFCRLIIFISEHFYRREHFYLSIFFRLSICLSSEHFCSTENRDLSIFFKQCIFKNDFPFWALFKLNIPDPWKE